MPDWFGQISAESKGLGPERLSFKDGAAPELWPWPKSLFYWLFIYCGIMSTEWIIMGFKWIITSTSELSLVTYNKWDYFMEYTFYKWGDLLVHITSKGPVGWLSNRGVCLPL